MNEQIVPRVEILVGATVGAAMLAVVGFASAAALVTGARLAEGLEIGKLMVEHRWVRKI